MKNELIEFCKYLSENNLIQKSVNHDDITNKFIKLHSEKLHGLNDIAEIVAKSLFLDVSDLNKRTRKREVVEARQIAMCMMHRYTKLSLAGIGAYFENENGVSFDHATVLHACKTVNDLKETNRVFRERFEEIENLIKTKFESNAKD